MRAGGGTPGVFFIRAVSALSRADSALIRAVSALIALLETLSASTASSIVAFDMFELPNATVSLFSLGQAGPAAAWWLSAA